MTMRIETIAATVHGRYLVDEGSPDRLLAGFHGYAESAETHLEELRRIPGAGAWTLAAVQALHPFYTRTGSVVASWMTSLDRELALADNINYVRRVIAAFGPRRMLVFAGFSQGASMAARAAAAIPAAGLILLGGDIPPDVTEDPAVRLPPVLLGRGTDDAWYTEEKLKKDLSYLQSRTVVTPCLFGGGHEWTDAFREAASAFLREVSR